ncbi:unnamed protein product [Euphydryas editha]|uniref:MADF domain-containing protein n=1 Tax=Euphydryas editha TaxID=104508 RepID=A0AAU9TYE8_EUPED|nr:unnamed protein product [Euphydryas editha]
MASEIRLVQEIEKYECLYNNYLPEYNRKDLAEEAWTQVSQSTDLTVTECKEKWRNIRSSLLRSLKPSDKTKKPYYLAPYLHFVLPFMKPLNCLEYKEDIHSAGAVRNSRKDADILICAVKSEDDTQTLVDTINTEITDEESHLDPLSSQPSSPVRKRKRNDTISSRKLRRSEQQETKLSEEQIFNPIPDPPRSSAESMRYFLMSLLPEFETMTEEQSRMFKIKVMMLIDDIKSNYNKMKQNVLSTNESSRLQKRLINLLLKSLENKS